VVAGVVGADVQEGQEVGHVGCQLQQLLRAQVVVPEECIWTATALLSSSSSSSSDTSSKKT
jgi:hypothetical protein